MNFQSWKLNSFTVVKCRGLFSTAKSMYTMGNAVACMEKLIVGAHGIFSDKA